MLFFASYNHCYVHVRVPLLDSAIIELQPFVIPFVHQSFQLVDFRRLDNLRSNSQHIVCAIQIVLPVCIYHGMRRFCRVTRIVGCQICNDIFRRDVSKTMQSGNSASFCGYSHTPYFACACLKYSSPRPQMSRSNSVSSDIHGAGILIPLREDKTRHTPFFFKTLYCSP